MFRLSMVFVLLMTSLSWGQLVTVEETSDYTPLFADAADEPEAVSVDHLPPPVTTFVNPIPTTPTSSTVITEKTEVVVSDPAPQQACASSACQVQTQQRVSVRVRERRVVAWGDGPVRRLFRRGPVRSLFGGCR